MERRVGEVERRLGWLDEHGTRGVDVIRTQLSEQAADIGEIKGQVEGTRASLNQAISELRRGMGIRQTAFFLASLLPVYVLLLLALVKK